LSVQITSVCFVRTQHGRACMLHESRPVRDVIRRKTHAQSQQQQLSR